MSNKNLLTHLLWIKFPSFTSEPQSWKDEICLVNEFREKKKTTDFPELFEFFMFLL